MLKKVAINQLLFLAFSLFVAQSGMCADDEGVSVRSLPKSPSSSEFINLMVAKQEIPMDVQEVLSGTLKKGLITSCIKQVACMRSMHVSAHLQHIWRSDISKLLLCPSDIDLVQKAAVICGDEDFVQVLEDFLAIIGEF